MPSPVTEKNFTKVFILYLLWNIDMPLDYVTINDIMMSDGYLNYFDFAECFTELVDDGLISKSVRDDGVEIFRITKPGINVAENLSGDIFDTIRDRSLKSALRLISFKERGAELKYECEDIPDAEGGGYAVTCSIYEHGRKTCSVTVKADSKKRADAIRDNFYERPEAIYRGAFALLVGDMNFIF